MLYCFNLFFHLLLIGNKIIGLYFIDGYLNTINFLKHILSPLRLIFNHTMNNNSSTSTPDSFFIDCEKQSQ